MPRMNLEGAAAIVTGGASGRRPDRGQEQSPDGPGHVRAGHPGDLLGTFNMLRQAAAAMARTDPLGADGARGAIVNMASVAAFDGQIGQAAYSASKGGIVGMTLPIARDLSAVGIRVNTVAPGLIDTPIYGTGEAAEEFKSRLGTSVLFPRRLGSAEELAFMVTECVTNPYVNGETIRVDGGVRLPPK
jgi:NAD(P)-dependent dehydrogenase (short-subunit alcohol dehydrogenase family)